MKVFLLELIQSIAIVNGVLAFLFCLLILGGFYIDSTRTHQVSIIPLITNSWAYHGKKVQTRGFLQLDFESEHRHLNQESYEQKLDNYIWLNITQKQMIDCKPLDRHYVIVEGTFDGTIGRRSFRGIGSIKVTRLQGINSERYSLN